MQGYDPARSMTLGDILARQARRLPEHEAFVDAGRRLTFAAFNRRVNRLANALRGLGVSRGDRVAALLPNSAEIEEVYFACAKLGALAVPLNFRFVPEEAAYVVHDAGASVLVYDEAFRATVDGARPQLATVRHFVRVNAPDRALEAESGGGDLAYEELLRSASEDEPHVPVDEDDGAFIMYTSGTTGRPKGAVLTHRNYVINATNLLAEGILLGPGDRYLCVPPVFHTAALAVTVLTVYSGACTVMMRAFDPKEVLAAIQRERISVLFLVPAMWNMLLQVPEPHRYDVSSLRIGVTGAAIMPTRLKEQVMARFPGVGIWDAFGQTEMSPVVTLLKPQDALRKPGSVGKAVVNVEIRVVDDQDRDVPPGEVGEAIYRGPTVMKEYWRNPQATAEALRGGWFHSGDLVRQDADGYLYVVDRKKDVIITGGENVYPAEVEEVLYRHPAILEAAVVGAPDPKWGEAVLAVVVPRPGHTLTADEVIAWCEGRLAGYKKPRRVEFVQALPRNSAGKVQKQVLRQQYGNPIRYDV